MQENAPWPSDPKGHNAGNGTGGGNRDGFQQQPQPQPQQQRFQYDVGDEPPLEYGIFVSDIARGVTDQELKDAFSSAGQVTDALVVKNKFTGETKGFGFVKFATLDAVHAALDMAVLPSFRDAVSSRVQTVKVVRADPKNVLYVGNIPRGLSEDDVRLALQEATTTYEVTKFKLCTTLEGESKGYGWATFKDHKCAVQGMRLLQSTPVFGLYLNVHMAEPRTQEEDMLARVKSLFVRGVSPTTNAETMKAFFGDGCEKVVIPLDVTTRAVLGHAFVHFATRQQAEVAMQRCQNATLEGESQPLTMEWCLPKEFIRGKGRGAPLRGGPGDEMGGGWGAPPYGYGGPPPPPPPAGGYYGGGGWEDYDDGSGRWAPGGGYRGGYRGRGGPPHRGGPYRGRGGGYRGGYGGPPPPPPYYGAAAAGYGVPPPPPHQQHYPPPPPPHYQTQAYGHHQPAYAPPPPPAAYGYGDPTAYSQPGYHPAPAATPTAPTPAATAGAGAGTAPVAPAGTDGDATAATNYSQQHQYNYYAGATTGAAPGADPYYGTYGAYDPSRAAPAYAGYPPAPPPDYTQGYYGSPAGGKALAPRDAPRYNPY